MDVRLGELWYGGAWNVHRGLAPDGQRVVVTIVDPPPSDAVLAGLALPFDGIARLRGVSPAPGGGVAIIEDDPGGWTIGELRWPLPIDEVIRAGLALARL